jgi:hypothetical protein
MHRMRAFACCMDMSFARQELCANTTVVDACRHARFVDRVGDGVADEMFQRSKVIPQAD